MEGISPSSSLKYGHGSSKFVDGGAVGGVSSPIYPESFETFGIIRGLRLGTAIFFWRVSFLYITLIFCEILTQLTDQWIRIMTRSSDQKNDRGLGFVLEKRVLDNLHTSMSKMLSPSQPYLRCSLRLIMPQFGSSINQ